MENKLKKKGIQMKFEIELNRLLSENLTETAYKFWEVATEKVIPKNVWQELASSSKKYHNKEGGFVPTIAEHTCEMLRGAIKCMSMFGITKKTSECDLLLMGVVLHDAFKRGADGTNRWTANDHDKLIADKVMDSTSAFHRFLSKEQHTILIDMVRFHSGKWSTDADKDFDFAKLHPYVLFVHTLDMLSSRNCLKLILGDP